MPVEPTRVVIIGGTGHVGTYLVPQLVARGYHVINVSRGTAKPYLPHSAWNQVENVVIDRKAEEEKGNFGKRIAELKGDIVIDMITFEPSSAHQLVEALIGNVEFYVFCSTIWVYGHLTSVPVTESAPTNAFDDYGKKKAEIEKYLMGLARRKGFPATSFRPGHIVGKGWKPVNPQGNLNTDVWETISRGEELLLPNIGLEMLNHVHADDCARWVLAAIDNQSAAVGECFNVVASQSSTLRGLSEAMYRYFGQEPKLAYKPLEEWAKSIQSQDDVNGTRSHVEHSPCSSVEKSRERLGWKPRYTSLEMLQESVEALIADGKIKVNRK